MSKCSLSGTRKLIDLKIKKRKFHSQKNARKINSPFSRHKHNSIHSHLVDKNIQKYINQISNLKKRKRNDKKINLDIFLYYWKIIHNLAVIDGKYRHFYIL